MLKVCGFKRVEYVSKKTNNPVNGYEVYLIDQKPDEKMNVSGMYVEVAFINDKYACYRPVVGDVVRLSYNRFGNVEDLIPQLVE